METKYTFQYLSLGSRPFFSEYVGLYVVDGRLQNWGRHSHINGTFILWKEAFSVWTHWLETLFTEKDAPPLLRQVERHNFPLSRPHSWFFICPYFWPLSTYGENVLVTEEAAAKIHRKLSLKERCQFLIKCNLEKAFKYLSISNNSRRSLSYSFCGKRVTLLEVTPNSVFKNSV